MNNSIVALGKFDGVHIGHDKLLKTAIEVSGNLKKIVYTFKMADKKTILSDGEKESVLLAYGFDEVYFEQFTDDYKKISPESFVHDILKGRLDAAHVVVGYNYHFGRGASGDADVLKNLCGKCGINVIVIDEVDFDGIPVSSTRIRLCLEKGDIVSANALLGRNYFVSSTVISGKRLGREMGFPTVNFKVSDLRIMPKSGVYITRTFIGGLEYRCVTNIGYNPTVEDTETKKMETYIIDFDGDLYGETLKIEFLKMIRDERKFDSIDSLTEQLKKDIKTASAYL